MIPDREALRQILAAYLPVNRFLLAYSGGVDSHALLHLMSGLDFELTAIYVDHGLQPHSKAWGEHCRQHCSDLGVPFIYTSVNVESGPGTSLEAEARKARYSKLKEYMLQGDCLLTAHHQDDQAETLVLQLLRGAGAPGLAAMPAIAPCGPGKQARPLLGFSREEILRYAEKHQLQWVDDPSNADVRFDRNLIRQQLIPLLRQRWPSVSETLCQVAAIQAENVELLRDLAAMDMAKSAQGEQLSVAAIRSLSPVRQKNLIRYWLHRLELPVPPRKQLQQIIDTMLTAAEDAEPLVRWEAVEIRRYQDFIYAMRPLGKPEEGFCLSWDGGGQTLWLESLQASLSLHHERGRGIRPEHLKKSVEVRFRRGGESILLPGRQYSRSLKKLFQDAQVPPWEWGRIPLLYIDGQLAAVVGYWVAQAFSVDGNEIGLWPVLRPAV